MSALFTAILGVLAAIGAPLFLIVGTATALCFYLFTPDHNDLADLLPMMQNMEGLLTKQEFLAIPLFMASGAIMTTGGIARRLVDVARAALGWLPGGMAVASVAACMFFAAISGSSPVTLIAVGSIMLPAMLESKYPEPFALGLVTSAGSLGCLVPPSIAMLIYAISLSGSPAGVSPEDIFLAGLLPALLIAGLLALYAIWVGRRSTEREPFEGKRLRVALRNGSWALLLPVLVLGGIYEFLALIDVRERLMELIRSLNLGPVGFMLLVNVVLIVIGALMDSISCTLIFAPMLAPVAYELYGIDPVHFGVVFVVNMEIGYLMPPVATNLFVAAAVFKKSFGEVTRAVLPSLGIVCAALVLIIYVPTISVAAVNWKAGRPMYLAFPWDGKPSAGEEVAVEADDGAPAMDPAADDGAAQAPKAFDLSSLTKKSMDSMDDEEGEPKDAPKVKPLDLSSLTKKAMDGLDAEEKETPAPADEAQPSP